MSEKLLKEVISELGSIYSNIPNETSLYNVEDKLDKLIELIEYQNEVSNKISNQLDHIYNDMPSGSINLSRVEDRLDKISDKLNSVNTNLGYIESNTAN
jgi:archaellum component FlaC